MSSRSSTSHTALDNRIKAQHTIISNNLRGTGYGIISGGKYGVVREIEANLSALISSNQNIRNDACATVKAAIARSAASAQVMHPHVMRNEDILIIADAVQKCFSAVATYSMSRSSGSSNTSDADNQRTVGRLNREMNTTLEALLRSDHN